MVQCVLISTTWLRGVTNGFKKTLKLVGVGYRAQLKSKTLTLNVGYSNPVEMQVPDDSTVEVPDNTTIDISGISKQAVGDFAQPFVCMFT